MLAQSNAGQNAGPTSTDLELVNYGRGHAWLRRELDVTIADAEQLDQDLTRRLGWPEPQPAEPRYVLIQAGRDALARAQAMSDLFDQGWPTLAEMPA